MMEGKNKKQTRKQAWLMVLLVAAALFLANVLFQRIFLRADLTEENEYTLSDGTKNILKGLKDPITLKVYFSENLPPAVKPMEQGVFDLLDEYRIYSGSKINIVRVVPEESPQSEQEAQLLGIPPLQLNVIRQDKQELIKVYLGLALFYLDKKEVIPVTIKVDQLEYDLTAAILKLTIPHAPRLGFMAPQADAGEENPYNLLEQVLKRQFDLVKLDPSPDTRVQQTFDAFLMVDPREAGTEIKKELDSLFDKGIPVVLLASRVDVGNNLEASTYQTGLEDWFKEKGIELDPRLIIDPKNHANATFTSQWVQYNVPYPFFVQVPRDGLNQESAATAKLENIMFPWTNTLKIFAEEHVDWKYAVLAKSSSASLFQEGPPDVNPQAIENFQQGEGGAEVISVQVNAPSVDQGGTERRLVVVANTQFVKDHVIKDYQGNLVFVQNLLDWLTLGDQLIGIRSRGKTARPIEPPSPAVVSAIKFGHMVGIPLAVIGFGILSVILRKKKRERIAVYFRV
ncbi:MAG: GldG family protein [Deltaproteobacteria bacterium]|nr:GldG family protein [Deltaproteobacteria bacterium]